MGGSSTTPKFEGNEPRVYEIESAALHPLYHALPKPVAVSLRARSRYSAGPKRKAAGALVHHFIVSV